MIVTINSTTTNDQTTVAMTLTNNEHVSVYVTDIQGRVVVMPVESDLVAGEHDVLLNTGDLPSGLYLIIVNSGNDSRKVKLQVMH